MWEEPDTICSTMRCYEQHAGGDACHGDALRNCQERGAFTSFLHDTKTFQDFAQVWFIFKNYHQPKIVRGERNSLVIVHTLLDNE